GHERGLLCNRLSGRRETRQSHANSGRVAPRLAHRLLQHVDQLVRRARLGAGPGLRIALAHLARRDVARVENDRHAGLGKPVGKRVDVAVCGEHVEDRTIRELVFDRIQRAFAIGIGAFERVAKVAHRLGQVERDDEFVFDDEYLRPLGVGCAGHFERPPAMTGMACEPNPEGVFGSRKAYSLPNLASYAALSPAASRRAGSRQSSRPMRPWIRPSWAPIRSVSASSQAAICAKLVTPGAGSCWTSWGATPLIWPRSSAPCTAAEIGAGAAPAATASPTPARPSGVCGGTSVGGGGATGGASISAWLRRTGSSPLRSISTRVRREATTTHHSTSSATTSAASARTQFCSMNSTMAILPFASVPIRPA